MAYKSKYYDPVKAHEYYMKHRQLKGRTKTNTQRGSTAGLNDVGKIAAEEVKEQLNAELKAALAKLPKRGATEARKKLRAEYKERYYAELDKIRQDTGFARVKATKTKAASTRSTGTSSRSTGTRTTANATQPTTTKTAKAKETAVQTAMNGLNKINKLAKAFENMPDEQKETMQGTINSMISKLTAKLDKQLSKNKTVGSIKGADNLAAAMNAISSLKSKLKTLPEESKKVLAPKIQSIIDKLSSKIKGNMEVQEVSLTVTK